MSSPESAASPSADGSSPAANGGSPENPPGNKYDQMFGSDNESVPADEEEDDEDAGVRKRSRKSDGDNALGGDAAQDDDDADADDDDDLFGDDMVDEPQKELEGTPEIDQEDEEPERVYRSIDVSLPRHPVPDPGDEDIYLLRVPNFISMQQQLFYPETFTLPKLPTDSTTSAYTVATNTIRVRQNPVDPAKLQSNARIIRWSDGTLSLQIASSTNLYDLPSKPLAPSHKNPQEYDPSLDSHTYLLTPHESAGMLRVLGHATQALGVLPAVMSLQNDDAITKLSEELSAAIASRAGRRGTGKNIEIADMKDPEAERREAERLDRERQRQAKKIENQKKKAREIPGALGRDDSAVRPRFNHRSSHTRSKRESPPLTKGPGRTREDEYDLDDGFVEGTDEEEELEGSDEEEDSDDDRRRKKGKAKKRKEKEVVEEEEEEEEAEFTDEERPAPRASAARGKRRRVVEDDDEDDE